MNDCEELINRAEYMTSFKKYKGQKIYIYGAGQMGREAYQFLKKGKVEIKAYIDKNFSMHGKKVNGIPVVAIDEPTVEDKTECMVAIGITKFSYNSIYEELKSKGYKQICYIGHLIESVYKGPSIANVWYFSEMTDKEKKQILHIYDCLYDEESRQAFLQVLEWNLYGVECERKQGMCLPEDKYFIKEVRNCLSQEEVFIDCGAYNGNTIERIEKVTNNQYKRIYAFEPEPNNFLKLKDFINQDQIRKERVSIFEFGLGNIDGQRNFTVGLDLTSRYVNENIGEKREIRKLDSIMEYIPYSFLKVYGLGIGREVIQGALHTIEMNRPIVAVNIYHTKEDFIEIPTLLIDCLKEYNIYLRLHGYCGGEAVVYAIPKEKIKHEG